MNVKKNTVPLIFKSLDWTSRHRYSLLVAFLFIRIVTFASNGFWSGDFWEHSAVIKELIERPLNPQHPLFLLDAPNAFMSPYSLLVATFARLLSINSIEALSIFSLINFLLLAYGLRRFCSVIAPEHAEISAFYSLILTLLLWGNDPWPYSGFLHIQIIETVLPYPSTFSIALSLIGISLFIKSINAAKTLTNFVLYFILCFVLLSHPLTFIFLLSGLFFLCFYNSKSLFKNLIKLSTLVVATFFTAAIWPYFSIFELLLSGSKVYHTSNLVMYLNIFDRIWPNIFLLPFIGLMFNSRIKAIVLLWIITLLFLYGYGTISSNYSYGRILSYCILLFHINAACVLAQLESNFEKTHLIASNIYRSLLFIFLVVCSFAWLPSSSSRLLTIANQIRKHHSFINKVTYKNLIFIKDHIASNQLVLSDLQTSWLIPTFNGKVIAALHPQAFIPDALVRQQDINIFFNENTTNDERMVIINKYHPEFLLLNVNNPSSYLIERNLSEFIELLDSNDQYRLFKFL